MDYSYMTRLETQGELSGILANIGLSSLAPQVPRLDGNGISLVVGPRTPAPWEVLPDAVGRLPLSLNLRPLVRG